MPSLRFPAALFSLLIVGCASTGDDAYQVSSLPSAATSSPLGFSLDDVLSRRRHNAFDLNWGSAGPAGFTTSSTTTLTLDLTYSGAPIQVWQANGVQPHDPNGGQAAGSHLETQIDVLMATADGALNEHIQGRLSATGPESMTIEAVAPPKLDGTLNIKRFVDDVAARVWLEQLFDGQAARGTIDLVSTLPANVLPSGAMSGGGSMAVVARWSSGQ